MSANLRQFLYRSSVEVIRLYSRLAWDFRVLGRWRIPPGPKLYVSNHVTSFDLYWVMMAVPDFLHFVLGPPYSIRGFRHVLAAFEQINALSEHRKTAVRDACRYLSLGRSVCIYPEGDVQPPFRMGHFYTGLAKIYRLSNAPIIPVALAVSPVDIRRHPKWDLNVDGRCYEARMVWRGKVRLMIGEAMTPQFRHDLTEEEDDRRITEEVRARIGDMLQELSGEFEFQSAPRILDYAPSVKS